MLNKFFPFSIKRINIVLLLLLLFEFLRIRTYQFDIIFTFIVFFVVLIFSLDRLKLNKRFLIYYLFFVIFNFNVLNDIQYVFYDLMTYGLLLPFIIIIFLNKYLLNTEIIIIHFNEFVLKNSYIITLVTILVFFYYDIEFFSLESRFKYENSGTYYGPIYLSSIYFFVIFFKKFASKKLLIFAFIHINYILLFGLSTQTRSLIIISLFSYFLLLNNRLKLFFIFFIFYFLLDSFYDSLRLSNNNIYSLSGRTDEIQSLFSDLSIREIVFGRGFGGSRAVNYVDFGSPQFMHITYFSIILKFGLIGLLFYLFFSFLIILRAIIKKDFYIICVYFYLFLFSSFSFSFSFIFCSVILISYLLNLRGLNSGKVFLHNT